MWKNDMNQKGGDELFAAWAFSLWEINIHEHHVTQGWLWAVWYRPIETRQFTTSFQIHLFQEPNAETYVLEYNCFVADESNLELGAVDI